MLAMPTAVVLAATLIMAQCAAAGGSKAPVLLWGNASLSPQFRPGGVFTPTNNHVVVSHEEFLEVLDVATGARVGKPFAANAGNRLTMVNNTLFTTAGTSVYAFSVSQAGGIESKWQTRYWTHGQSESWCDLNFPVAGGNVVQTFSIKNAAVAAFNADSGAMQWTKHVGPGEFACAVASRSTVFFAQSQFVTALNAVTGATLWNMSVVGKLNVGQRTLSVDGDRVYAPFTHGVAIFSATNGSVIAELKTVIAAPFTVALSDGVLLFNAYTGTGPSIVKFSREYLKAWTFNEATYCTPVEAAGTVYTCSKDHFIALDARSGAEIGRTRLPVAIEYDIGAITVRDGYALLQTSTATTMFRV